MVLKKSSNVSNNQNISRKEEKLSPSIRASSPSDSADFDLYKYAIRNGFRMERRTFPCRSAEYEIEIADVENCKEDIIDMLINNFLRDETLVKSLRVNSNMTKLEEDYYEEDERLLMYSALDEATVLIAVHKETKRLSGCLVIKITKKTETEDGDKKLDDKKVTETNEGEIKSRAIKDFLYYVEEMKKRGINLTDKYPDCKLYAEFELIGVNKLDRRKGLGLDLYEAGLKIVKEMPEVRVLSGIYTSIYSKILAEKIGKKIISSVDVFQFKDKFGNPVFQDTKPHNIISLMAMEI